MPVDIGKTVDLPIAGMPAPEELPGYQRHQELLAAHDLTQQRDMAYSLIAIELALQDAGLTMDGDRIGMIQAFEAPGVETTVGRMLGLFGSGEPPPRDFSVYQTLAQSFYNMQPFLYVHVMAKAFGFRGFCTNVHNACATGAFAIDAAAQQIRNQAADVMVVVGGEAFDTAVRLEWFRALSLYAGEHVMRPFGPSPSGFYVGEGGIALVLESAEHARKRGAEAYAEYVGGSFCHQAWKQTLPDVRSERLTGVMTDVMQRHDLSSDRVDLILPHAACTSLSDNYESHCVARAIGAGSNAMASAFKPHIGHMLAASGLMELAAGLLSMRHGSVPGTLHADSCSKLGEVPLRAEVVERQVDLLMKLSTGFTGHDAASLYKRV